MQVTWREAGNQLGGYHRGPGEWGKVEGQRLLSLITGPAVSVGGMGEVGTRRITDDSRVERGGSPFKSWCTRSLKFL